MITDRWNSLKRNAKNGKEWIAENFEKDPINKGEDL